MFTRGSEKAIRLQLEGADDATTIEVQLAASGEGTTTPASFRPLAPLPAESFVLATKDIAAEKAYHDLVVDRFTDRVSLRKVDPTGAIDQVFECLDTDTPDHGDYYYIRLRQLDGAMAWSSPIWVGGFASQ